MVRKRAKLHLHDDVETWIEEREKIPQRQIRLNIDKLERYGDEARMPLVRHIKGPIWELRAAVSNHGLYRIFYFQIGENSYYGFDRYKKGGQKLPEHVRDRVFARYEELTGDKI